MQLTKHVHACVTLAKGEARIVIDPGSFTPDAAQAVAAADAVFITHEHVDHFDETLIARSLEARPDLRVYGPAAVVGRWSARSGQVVATSAGDVISVAGFEVSVFGGLHGVIHRDIPPMANVGYLVDGSVYHPGDAYDIPDTRVDTLLIPTNAPWTKVGETVDYVRSVAPKRLIQIHELALSPLGQKSMSQFLSPPLLTDAALTIVPNGDTITV
jgi:L-ascorbate metabolism protein UlaG (beta-lactamase superfamily)